MGHLLSVSLLSGLRLYATSETICKNTKNTWLPYSYIVQIKFVLKLK